MSGQAETTKPTAQQLESKAHHHFLPSPSLPIRRVWIRFRKLLKKMLLSCRVLLVEYQVLIMRAVVRLADFDRAHNLILLPQN